MKTVMVIPTYWARESATGWQPGDAVYDHPTPIDEEVTLREALDSLTVLESNEFSLLILACATTPEIEKAVEERVLEIVQTSKRPVGTYVVSHSHLRDLQAIIAESGNEELADILSLTGYANIRNMCLFVPYVLGAEVVVLIDDDDHSYEYVIEMMQKLFGYRIEKGFVPAFTAFRAGNLGIMD